MRDRYELCAVAPDGGEDIASSHPTEDDARHSARSRADGRVYIVRDAQDDRRAVGESIYAPPGASVHEPDTAADVDQIKDPDPIAQAQVSQPAGGE